MLDGPDRELRARGQAELAKDVADVPFGGGLGDHELVRNGAVTQAAGNKRCHRALTRRELASRIGWAGRCFAGARLWRRDQLQRLTNGSAGRQSLTLRRS